MATTPTTVEVHAEITLELDEQTLTAIRSLGYDITKRLTPEQQSKAATFFPEPDPNERAARLAGIAGHLRSHTHTCELLASPDADYLDALAEELSR